MTIDQLMTDVLNMDYDEILGLANSSLPNVLRTLDALSDTPDECFNMFINVIGSMISADGMIRDKERQLYCDLFNTRMSFDEFFNMVSGRNDVDLRESVNSLIDRLGLKDEEIKNDFLTVLLCFACVDERLAADEKAYFKKLLY